MVKHTSFITQRRTSEILFLVSLVIAVALLFSEVSKAADSASPRIVGSWQVYRDDDRPEGPVPNETMSFWANGKILISGDHPNKGFYQINGNHLEFLIKKGDRAIRADRRFELSDEELKFKNRKTGWVYYKRVSEQPEGEEPDLK